MLDSTTTCVILTVIHLVVLERYARNIGVDALQTAAKRVKALLLGVHVTAQVGFVDYDVFGVKLAHVFLLPAIDRAQFFGNCLESWIEVDANFGVLIVQSFK